MSTIRPGDWNCPYCQNHNFASRAVCKQCREPKPASQSRPGEWQCKCGELNFAKRTECRGCSAPQPAAAAAAAKKAEEEKSAVATVKDADDDGDGDDDDDDKQPKEQVSPKKRARTLEQSAAFNGLDDDNTELTLIVHRPEGGDAVPSAPRKEYYLTVDIERVGPGFKHGILAIGVCFGDTKGNVLVCRAFCGHVPPIEDFDRECYNDFWINYPDVLKRINNEATYNPIARFHEFLVSLEHQYGPFGRAHRDRVHMKLVSDNPAYDIGMINLEFFKNGYPLPMAEMWNGGYVPTDDPSEQIRGLTAEQKAQVEKFITATHSHFPSDDAMKIYQQRCGIKSVLG